MTPAKKRHWWIYILVICLCAFLIWRFYFKNETSRPPMEGDLPPVRIATAISQNVPHYLNGLGTVTPSGDVLVQSRVSGQLLRLHFKEGQQVKDGDLLAEIDPRPFQAELDKARGALQKNLALLQNAKSDLVRYAKLVKNDFISTQQYENQMALVRQYEGEVETNQAAVAAAALQLEYSRVMAPISGRLGLRAVDEGNQITANDPNGIVRITETSPCDVIFTIPESQVGLVAAAMRRREKDASLPPLEVQAWDREDKQLLATGELVSLDNQIDHATGTVRLKAQFPNKRHRLYPNQFVNARLLVQTLHDVTTIPSAAVQLGAKGSYCYVIIHKGEPPADIAEYRDVIPGIIDNGVQVIEKGISPGEQVVVDGLDRLRNDIPVRIAATIDTPLLDPGSQAAPDGAPAHSPDASQASHTP